MESQSLQKLAPLLLCTSQSSHLFLVNKRYPIKVKPLNLFSTQTPNTNPEDHNSSREEGLTEDTISDSKENREVMTTFPENKISSCVFSSQPNSARQSPKSILKSPKIGKHHKKPECFSNMQSFLDSNLNQEDSDETFSLNLKEVRSLSNQATPRRKFRRVAYVKAASLNVSPLKSNPNKRVTFATRLVQSQEPSEISENESGRPNSSSKEPTVRLVNNYSLSPIKPPTKLIHNLFTFSAEELSQNVSKSKPSVREKRILVPNIKSDLNLKDLDIASNESPTYNLSNRPTRTVLNLRLPLVLANTKSPTSYEKQPIVSETEKTPVAFRIGRREGSLSSRESSRKGIFSSNLFK